MEEGPKPLTIEDYKKIQAALKEENLTKIEKLTKNKRCGVTKN